jgi:large subunit ribosomal protein L18
MYKNELNKKRRTRRKKSIRLKINGTSQKPRLSVYKSNKYIYVQAIDDTEGKTLVSASNLKYEEKEQKLNTKIAVKVGEDIAKKLKEKNISEVVFDRNGFLYTGRIKALADSARKNGIKF